MCVMWFFYGDLGGCGINTLTHSYIAGRPERIPRV